MTKAELIDLKNIIEDISLQFKNNSLTENVELLKAKNLESPNKYLKITDQLEALLVEFRILFLHSVFNIICKIENQNYMFDEPFQANMKYYGVMKNKETFYLLDEDGHYREIFTSNEFIKFIDDLYWKSYQKY